MEAVLTLKAHESTVSCLCFIGNSLFSCSKDKTIKQWDLSKGKIVQTLSGHSGWIRSLSTVDSQLVSGSWDDSVIVWDLEQRKSVHKEVLSGYHDLGINAVWVDVEQRRVYSGSDDGSICVWDIQTSGLVDKLLTTGSIKCLAGINKYFTDSLLMVSGMGNGSILLWNAHSGQITETLAGHTAECNALLVNPTTGNTLFSAGNDCMIYEWHLPSASRLRAFHGHSGYVSSLVWLSNSNALISAAWDGSVKVWNTADASCCQSIQVHEKSVNALAVNGSTLVTGTSDGLLKTWDLSTIQIPAVVVVENTYHSFPTDGYYQPQYPVMPVYQPQNNNKLCVYYQRGNCRFGDQCRFIHT